MLYAKMHDALNNRCLLSAPESLLCFSGKGALFYRAACTKGAVYTLLKEFVDNYGLTVNEEKQDALDELLAAEEEIRPVFNAQDQLDEVAATIEFSVKDEKSDYKEYVATLENVTDLDFSVLEVDIQLLSEDGDIIDNTFNIVEHLSSGQKANIRFSSNKDFSNTKCYIKNWEME